jgi:HPt (histidine-containing phosphotransfer) domain-containing protein
MDTGAAVAADNVERMASIPPARDEAAVPTGGEEPSDLAEVDVPHVQALLDDLSLEVLTELFSSFRTDAVTLLDQLGSAEGDATAERADAVLHALKGASQTVGLFRLAMTIQDMRQGPPPDARQVSRLRAALDAGLAALSDVLGTLKAREAA